jgi:hypothetical protein
MPAAGWVDKGSTEHVVNRAVFWLQNCGLEEEMPKRRRDPRAMSPDQPKGALRHDPRQRRPTYDQSEAQEDPKQRGAGLGEMPKPGTPDTDPREQNRNSNSSIEPKDAPRR